MWVLIAFEISVVEISYVFWGIVSFLIICYVLIMAGVGKQGKPLQSDDREIVCNVHKFFRYEGEAVKYLIEQIPIDNTE